jgi:hypothetical protein
LIGRRAAGSLLAALLACAVPASAQVSPYRVASETIWERLVLSLRIELDLAAAGLRLPQGRLEAERMIERDLPSLAKDPVFALTVDSYRSVGQTVADGTIDVTELLGVARLARRAEAAFSKDMRLFIAVYEFPILGIASLYVRHSAAAPLPAALAFRASRPYSGVVIYAKGELPVHGEGVEAKLVPCLFPKVFDDEMEIVLDRNALSPEALSERGPVGYASSAEGSRERIGDDPLRIMAEAAFGTNRTDLVISRDDVSKILALPENRELVRQGRVLIVLDLFPPATGR